MAKCLKFYKILQNRVFERGLDFDREELKSYASARFYREFNIKN